jgi:hypothetical protein
MQHDSPLAQIEHHVEVMTGEDSGVAKFPEQSHELPPGAGVEPFVGSSITRMSCAMASTVVMATRFFSPPREMMDVKDTQPPVMSSGPRWISTARSKRGLNIPTTIVTSDRQVPLFQNEAATECQHQGQQGSDDPRSAGADSVPL